MINPQKHKFPHVSNIPKHFTLDEGTNLQKKKKKNHTVSIRQCTYLFSCWELYEKIDTFLMSVPKLSLAAGYFSTQIRQDTRGKQSQL